jgi:AraC-like DNA-binding protein/CheY-like chemotaxis protein
MARTPATPPDRFALVTAGHHFLLNVLPFRAPESSDALAAFVATLDALRGPSADVDAILLRCLAVLDKQHGRRIPSLMDRYLANASTPDGSLARFTTCVEELLRDRCISDKTVQVAVEHIRTRFAEPVLDPRTIAEGVGSRLSMLDAAFQREMACTVAGYIREVRLERAAILLVTTHKTIKEIWAEIGYNHPSNFDHDFKRRFRVPPRDFRSGSIRPIAQTHFFGAALSTDDTHDPDRSPGNVLLIDDDECTRWSLSTYLSREGFAVSAAPSGSEGLRLAMHTCQDVILLDYRIGDMNGLEFLRRLHHQMPGKVPPVALFTADLNLFDRCDEVHALGATLVSKLCDLNQLHDLMTNLAAARTR